MNYQGKNVKIGTLTLRQHLIFDLLAKPEAAILLIRRALAARIKADYALMGTWFTTEPMPDKITGTDIDVIGMVKQLKQRYNYQGKFCTLPELRRFVRFDNSKNIFGSVVAATKTGIPVKIVICATVIKRANARTCSAPTAA